MEETKQVGRTPRYPFRNMEKGDSFLIPLASEKAIKNQKIYPAASKFSSRNEGFEFVTRKLDDGIRVWRTSARAQGEVVPKVTPQKMEYRVEKGIPIPSEKGVVSARKRKYKFFITMDVDDSEYIDDGNYISLISLASKYANKFNKKFKVTKESHKVCVTRLA